MLLIIYLYVFFTLIATTSNTTGCVVPSCKQYSFTVCWCVKYTTTFWLCQQECAYVKYLRKIPPFFKKRCLRTPKRNIFNSGRIFIPSLSKSGNFEVYFLRFLFIMTRFFPFLSQNYAVLRVLYQLRFLFLIFSQLSPQITVFSSLQQQQQQCIYLKKYKVYNTLCPANSYNANLGRTRL